MQRNKPIQRKTPLRSKTGLQRSKPLPSGKIPKRMKRTPEKRENPLKETWGRSKPLKDKSVYRWKVKTGKGMKRNKPMRKVSKKRLKVMRDSYFPTSADFLSRPENRYCLVCICSSIDATWDEAKKIMQRPDADRLLAASGAMVSQSTETHHQRGRIGKLLCDDRFFVPSCFACREVPHVRIAWAREKGLIAKASEWNVSAEITEHVK